MAILPIEYPDTAAAIQKRLEQSDQFISARKEDHVLLQRKDKLPKRGIFGLLIPRVKIKLAVTPGEVHFRIRPVGITVFMLFVTLGGVIVELVMDRTTYPREYPAEFVYALLVYFISMTTFEFQKTKRVLHDVIKNR